MLNVGVYFLGESVEFSIFLVEIFVDERVDERVDEGRDRRRDERDG